MSAQERCNTLKSETLPGLVHVCTSPAQDKNKPPPTGHGQHITLSTYHGDTYKRPKPVMRNHNTPPVEWSVVDTRACITRVQAMLASHSYGVCLDHTIGEVPRLGKA